MEPVNNQSPSATEPVETPAPEPKKSFVESIRVFFGVLQKIKSRSKVANEPTGGTDSLTSTEPVESSPPVSKKKPVKLIVFTVVLMVIGILFFVLMFVSRNSRTNVPLPTQEPTPVVSVEPEAPSPYANDEEVSEIRKNIENLNMKLNESSFRDETLRVPNLDWNVTFK